MSREKEAYGHIMSSGPWCLTPRPVLSALPQGVLQSDTFCGPLGSPITVFTHFATMIVPLNQWFSTGGRFSIRRHLAMPEDIVGCHRWGQCSWQLVGKCQECSSAPHDAQGIPTTPIRSRGPVFFPLCLLTPSLTPRVPRCGLATENPFLFLDSWRN